MFNEDEDWNDEQESKILSKTAFKTPQRANSSTDVKVVGKKSLLRTLQTLGSVPEWENTNHLQGSDSETETVPSHSKKKKKRSKRRKHTEKSEEPENAKINHTITEEKPLLKKKKKGKDTDSTNKITARENKKKEMTDSAKMNTNKLQSTEKMSRQQWKNKMKNKRKCKNKYRQNQPEENVNKAERVHKQEPEEEAKNDSQNDNNNESVSQTTIRQRKEEEQKPLKRKNNEEDIPTIEKQKPENKTLRSKAKKLSCDSSDVGSKLIPDEVQGKIPDEPQESSTTKRTPELTKRQSLKRQKLRKILLSQETDQHASPTEQKDEPALPQEAKVKLSGSDSFRARMEQRLDSARFRYINEVLYSTTSGEAKRMFQQDPQAFWVYHKGYTAQVQRWPANPVDQIITYIQNKSSSLVVADFGCGDCKIARSVKNKVHSFDLAATCDLVTVCDMANVPLGDSCMDMAVFCLSLMGTNLADFLAEANRVLKMGGVLKIAEVASRFDNVRNFVSALTNLGFKMVSKETENTHFYSFEFKKTGKAPENVKKYGLQLKPCVYKKR